MVHRIIILRAARRSLTRLPDDVYGRIWAAIQALALNPRPHGCVKLTNSPYWRIRIGDYRVIYEIDDAGKAVIVAIVSHRREVYRL